MIAPKNNISAPKNIWIDAERVTVDNLNLEQQFNANFDTSLVNNHIGSGVLPSALTDTLYFDTGSTQPDGYGTISLLDGIALYPDVQPSDTTFGNQLEVELTGSSASGRRGVKVCVIGVDFDGKLQYDRFTFYKNEKQWSYRLYTHIALIIINDLAGPTDKSLNLGGRLTIKEAKPFQISRDCLAVAQDVEPNLFFRDFYIASTLTSTTLGVFLAGALPEYNIDDLNITTSYKQLRSISQNDVTTRIAQKFLLTTDNIQKITLLLGAVGDNWPTIDPTDYFWSGDIVLSIYPLQSTVSCPTDLTPELPIDFEPTNIPVAEISFNYNSLLETGIKLTDVPQPVDFVFSNSAAAYGLNANSYYAITLKRSGAATQGIIQIPVSNDRLENSFVSIFNGTSWTDVTEDDLWFQVWSDSAKFTAGQAYENGNGIVVEKTYKDSSNTTLQYWERNHNFSRNDVFTALVSAEQYNDNPILDERTGNTVDSEQQQVPNFTLLNPSSLSNLSGVSNPLFAGTITDKNNKFIDLTNATFLSKLYYFGLVNNTLLIKIIDDPTDPRYDTSVLELVNKFLDGTLSNAKFTLNTAVTSNYFKVASTQLCSLTYGDLDGDGEITLDDLIAAQKLIGYDLTSAPSAATYDGYTKAFVAESVLQFSVIDPNTGITYFMGSDGIIIPDPNDASLASLYSLSVNWSSIPNLDTKKILITTATNAENIGSFYVDVYYDTNTITIRKILFNESNILKLFQSDITGNFIISTADTSLIENWVYKVNPFPPTTNPANKIGTKFNVLKINLEEFVDRNDDYYTSLSTRAETLHALPDLFTTDVTIESRNFLTNPLEFSYTKRITWDEKWVAATQGIRAVQAIFTDSTDDEKFVCNPEQNTCEDFPIVADFNPGKNDFYIPDNLLIEYGGELKRPDGYYYKVDLEIGTVVFEIPALNFPEEKSLNIFTDFVANYDGEGKTRLGYGAMKFADCSFVELDAISKEQIRFDIAVESFSPQLDGYESADISGIIVDNKIGVYMDHATGILKLNFTNLYDDPVLKTLKTRIQLRVLLKKAGFNNKLKTIDTLTVQNLFGLTSTIPTSAAPASPTITLSYNDGLASPQYGASTIQTALDAIKALLNPGGTIQVFSDVINVPIISGNQSTTSGTWVTLATFKFNPANYNPAIDTASIKNIILSVVANTTAAATGDIRLYNETDAAVVSGTALSTTSATSVELTTSALTLVSTNKLYSLQAQVTGSNTITIGSANLEITFV